jgi:chromosome segregation ATPase
MHYTIIHTSQPKRAVQVIQAIENYNTVVQTHEEKIFLKNLPYEPSVITFTKTEKPKNHVIGRRIELHRKAAIDGDASTYTFWMQKKKRRMVDSGAMDEGGAVTNNVEIRALQAALVDKDTRIAELELRPTIDAVDVLRAQIDDRDSRINVLTVQHGEQINTITAQHDEKFQALQNELSVKDVKVAELQTGLSVKDAKISDLQNELSVKVAKIADLRKDADSYEEELFEKRHNANELAAAKADNETLKTQVESLTKKVKMLESALVAPRRKNEGSTSEGKQRK